VREQCRVQSRLHRFEPARLARESAEEDFGRAARAEALRQAIVHYHIISLRPIVAGMTEKRESCEEKDL